MRLSSILASVLAVVHPVAPFTPYISPARVSTRTVGLKFHRQITLATPKNPALTQPLFLPTSLRSSPVSTPEPDEYNAKNTLFLIVGQALFIPLAGLISYLVPKLSIFSAGTLTPLTSPVFGSVAVSGALYVLPLGAFVLLTSSLESKFPALRQVAMATESTILSLLGSKRRLLQSVFFGCLLGAVAGLGEELLFRGCIQSSLSLYVPPSVSLALTSALFGLGHAITPLYAAISFIASLYFGWIFNSTGDLMIPIIAHGLYDAVAVVATHYIVTGKTREERDVLRSSFLQAGVPPLPPPPTNEEI
ncbi:hypothetical protein TrVE_jg6829 [Triparma verrucosa]|uniref:CAAX prenyl protease 2/Lysostaphin resistance protein A-like domain-containing protein n=1 Tax=Triparma verrucosa TaxID=1606542 RepID=A0A9W7BG10_9STRA|nr:hypothetical protein TrVE_jg6829 [Triparma verrucosa]